MAKHLKVLAKRTGYRRAGRGFSDTTPTYVPIADLKEGEEDILRKDTGLFVADEDPPAPGEEVKEEGKRKKSSST